MSEKPVYSAAAAMDPAASIASTNKVLSNTYWLLGLTLAFSALTATLGCGHGHAARCYGTCDGGGLLMLFVVTKPSGGQRRVSPLFLYLPV